MTGTDLTDRQRRDLAQEVLDVSKAFGDLYTTWLQQAAAPLAAKVAEAGLDPKIVFDQAADVMIRLAGQTRAVAGQIPTEAPEWEPVPPLRVVRRPDGAG